MNALSAGELCATFCSLYFTWLKKHRHPQGTLLAVLWQPLGGEFGGKGIHVCMAEFLRCQPEIVTASLISYTPI